MADDAEIRRLITAAHIVTEKLSALNNCTNMTELVQRFKVSSEHLSDEIHIPVNFVKNHC